MEICLLRHPTPLVEKGICYGQTNLELHACAEAEIIQICDQLPKELSFSEIYTSDLKRCTTLAAAVQSSHNIPHLKEVSALRELNFGQWEMQAWNDIDPLLLHPWMQNFTTQTTPEGESFLQLQTRVIDWVESLSVVKSSNVPKSILAVTHAGVIRVILCHVLGMPLENAFKFQLGYGCMVRLHWDQEKGHHALKSISLGFPSMSIFVKP